MLRWLFAPIYWSTFTLAWLVSALLWRVRPHFTVPLPRDQPYLLIANHVNGFDPAFVAVPLWRRNHFMATAALFKNPIAGAILRALGAFPKERGQKDKGASMALAEIYERGDVVTLFPEGVRSWDGRTQALKPGLGRLVKRLDATVVCARIRTGHLIGPRWARRGRWVPVELEYSAPMRWDAKADAEQIEAEIFDAIQIDVEAIRAPPSSRGWGLARGLPGYLWACPACSVPRQMRVDTANHVLCDACGAGWRVDLSARLNPDHGGAPITIATAFDRSLSAFGDPPRIPGATGGILDGDALLLRRGEEILAQGPGKVDEGALIIADFRLPFSDIQAVILESRSRIFLRTTHGTVQLEVGEDPPAMWHHVLSRWVSGRSA